MTHGDPSPELSASASFDQGEAAGSTRPDGAAHPGARSGAASTGRVRAGTSDRVSAVAMSLRQVYTSTLEESVPDAMLDLLKKLD